MMLTMSLKRSGSLLLAALLVTLMACAPGDPPLEPPFEYPPGLEPPEARIARAPDVGDLFPEVTIVDDEGQPVNIRELAGKKAYTVLTLGCLT